METRRSHPSAISIRRLPIHVQFIQIYPRIYPHSIWSVYNSSVSMHSGIPSMHNSSGSLHRGIRSIYGGIRSMYNPIHVRRDLIGCTIRIHTSNSPLVHCTPEGVPRFLDCSANWVELFQWHGNNIFREIPGVLKHLWWGHQVLRERTSGIFHLRALCVTI